MGIIEGGVMRPSKIEQLLRDGFPFAQHWHFQCTEGHVYCLVNGEDSIALHRHHSPDSWGAKLEGGPSYWTLAANEGSTPGEAIANLQQAITGVTSKQLRTQCEQKSD